MLRKLLWKLSDPDLRHPQLVNQATSRMDTPTRLQPAHNNTTVKPNQSLYNPSMNLLVHSILQSRNSNHYQLPLDQAHTLFPNPSRNEHATNRRFLKILLQNFIEIPRLQLVNELSDLTLVTLRRCPLHCLFSLTRMGLMRMFLLMLRLRLGDC